MATLLSSKSDWLVYQYSTLTSQILYLKLVSRIRSVYFKICILSLFNFKYVIKNLSFQIRFDICNFMFIYHIILENLWYKGYSLEEDNIIGSIDKVI
jgi:hypothetical protein